MDLAGARRAEVEASRAVHLAEACVEAVTALLARLEAAVTAWAPVRDESLRAEAMSQLVRGLGQDNQLQMRLSAYVLATRLDQVVAAANERLGHMRDQRYLLQRTDRAARKGSQAGLGLEVVDQWTGDVRAPATLSGGETFVVSLSLALGLADVVTQEAGGTEIETLFVDEGFGTLDADTLDDVMDRLDGLRAGGRTVGVVSHVSELRSRIPTQVHVDKGRTGSTRPVTHTGRLTRDAGARSRRRHDAPTTPMVAVVDIDGVVADVRHRLHHVTERPKDWRAFFAGPATTGCWPRARTPSARLAEVYDVVYLSGRPERLRAVTERWFARHDLPADRCCCAPRRLPAVERVQGRGAARSWPRPAPSSCSSTTTRGCSTPPGAPGSTCCRRPGWASTPRCARRRSTTAGPEPPQSRVAEVHSRRSGWSCSKRSVFTMCTTAPACGWLRKATLSTSARISTRPRPDSASGGGTRAAVVASKPRPWSTTVIAHRSAASSTFTS